MSTTTARRFSPRESPSLFFWMTIITLAAQEAIIMFIIRYLRTQMERSLRLQQTTITQLKDEITERKPMEMERESFIQELNHQNVELERLALRCYMS